MNWLQFAGRLHPLILHLPIGMLAALVALESFAILRRRPLEIGTRVPLAWLTALSAIAAAGAGWLLASENESGSQTLEWHRWLAIAFAALITLAALASASERSRKLYAMALAFAAAVLAPAGHLGGSLTHGEDFLFEPLRGSNTNGNTRGTPSDSPTATLTAFDRSIKQIFESRCVACHGPKKTKGGLQLHTLAALMKGGDGGAVVIPGDAASSELIRRIRLPKNDDDLMPPPAKPQLTPEQIEAIEAWVASGADQGPASPAEQHESPPTSPPADETVTKPLGAESPSSTDSTPWIDVSPPQDPKAPNKVGRFVRLSPTLFDPLRRALAHVEPIAPDSGLVWIDASMISDLDDARAAELLAPVVPAIAELSLAGTRITDALAPTLARMPNLRKLDLSRTRFTSVGLAALAPLVKLESINLTGLALGTSPPPPSATATPGASDASASAGPNASPTTTPTLDALASLPALRHVSLWRTGIDDDAIAAWAKRPANLTIELGQSIAAAPLETEPTPQVSAKSAPPTPKSPDAAASLKPANTACPVSGKALDPRYTIVHEGRVLGFCCEKCVQEFWSNPAKYAIK